MELFASLIDAVQKLYDLHQELVKLSAHKKEVLIAGDIQELERIVKEEVRHFQELTSLESTRSKLLTKISEQYRIPPNELTLSKLQNVVTDVNHKQAILKLSVEFPKVYEELKVKNDLNALLLNQSLQYVNNTMSLIYPDIAPATYQAKEEVAPPMQRSSLFDFKA